MTIAQFALVAVAAFLIMFMLVFPLALVVATGLDAIGVLK